MARRKTPIESVRAKLALAERLVVLRSGAVRRSEVDPRLATRFTGHPRPDLVQL